MVSYIWSIVVITAMEGDVHNYSYIKDYNDRFTCEMNRAVFETHFGPFADNEKVRCKIRS